MRDGGDDARLTVVPVDRADPGEVAEPRANAVGGDQQPCLDRVPLPAGAVTRPPAADGEIAHARRARRSPRRRARGRARSAPTIVAVHDHVSERLAVVGSPVEGQEHRPRRVAGPAVGDDHLGDRLGASGDLLPHAERSSMRRPAAAIAEARPSRRGGVGRRRIDERHRERRRGPAERQRQRQPDMAATGDEDIDPPCCSRSMFLFAAFRAGVLDSSRALVGRRPPERGGDTPDAERDRDAAVHTRPRAARTQSLPGHRSPQVGWQRVFGGQVIGQALVAAARTVEGRDRPFAARLFHAAGRSDGADHLRGRPHPRRQELHHAPGGRHPARRGDLLHVGLLPGRRRPGSSTRSRCRRCRRRRTCRARPSSRRSSSRTRPEPVRRYWERERPIELRPVDLRHYVSRERLDPAQQVWVRRDRSRFPTIPTSIAAFSPMRPT